MDRRNFLRKSALAIVVSASAKASAMSKGIPNDLAGVKQPNIILLFSDQQRHDTVGCYGEPIFEGLTPNLDKMAGEGVRFANSFTPQPVCGPARSCLQTGKYATQTGCFRNAIALGLEEKTIAHHLSSAGYEVGYIGKWHLASTSGIEGKNIDYQTKPVPPERRGGYKDYWLASDILEFTSTSYSGHMFDSDGKKREFPDGRYRVDVTTDWLLEYLKSRKSEKPFFLMTSYLESHHQNTTGNFEGPKGSKEKYKNFKVPGDLVDTKGDWRKQMPDYLGCCGSLDENLARVRKCFEDLKIADNTVVIYTSDHACHFRTRNGEYKRSCHDNSARTALIAYGPGFMGGKVVTDLVGLIDIAPTIMWAAGLSIPQSMHGKALQNVVSGEDKNPRTEMFMQISESEVGRAIRTKKWTYCVNAADKKGWSDACSDVYKEQYLYDLEKDPYQRNNIVKNPEYKAVRKQLAGRLIEHMKIADEAVPTILQA